MHACNLKIHKSNISLGHSNILQTPPLQGHLQFSDNWVRRWTMPKPKQTSTQGTEWTGAHHYGGKWQEQWTQHGWTGPSPLGSARKQWVCEPAFLLQLCQHCTVSQCSLGEHGFRDTTSEHISTNPLKWVRRKSTQRVDFWKRFGCCVTVRITAGYGEVLLIRFSCFLNYSKLF